ncbi:MAG: ATP-binding cassette domain-containing protein [Actinomycetia bacterium]|nr:ATP-binding cassette domain-containing protein [Actinomycetes bacterium]
MEIESSAASTQPSSSSGSGTNGSLLQVRGLSKSFPAERGGLLGRPTAWLSAVDDVDLDIAAGETLALVGESGCGKSTLARMIMRLIPATAGTVDFAGLDVLNADRQELLRYRQQAQMIFQDPYGSLDPRMNVDAIIAEGLARQGLNKAKRRSRVRQLLDVVELSADVADRYPHEFSGGQRQRISIARALAVNPTFIVADEPVSALDVSVQSTMLNFLHDLQDRFGLTYLFISHDMSVVRHVADRVAVMYLGKIVETAPVEELFGNPLHPYTQALLSSVPTVSREGPSERIVLEGDVPSAIDPPEACRFTGRCFRVIDSCRAAVPPLEDSAGTSHHHVACFNYEALPRGRSGTQGNHS